MKPSSELMKAMRNDVQERKVLYAAVWRWHFYAGLHVAPFLMLLAITGLVKLAAEPIEGWQLGALLVNTPGGTPTSHQVRLDAARSAFPHATFVRYQPGRDSADATRATVTINDGPHTVFADASSGHVRGIVDDGHRIGVVANLLHGTLLMGGLRLQYQLDLQGHVRSLGRSWSKRGTFP